MPPVTRDPELAAFKTDINLTEYAASLGYRINRPESSRNSVVMQAATGDKIIVALGEDDHWIYFSIRDLADNGSIIDFHQRRHGCSLGAVRVALRRWSGGGRGVLRPSAEAYAPRVERSSRDRQAVMAAYARMEEVADHPYLAGRGIGPEILGDARFAGTVRVDGHGAAVFPHHDAAGLCGYEMKNRGFTGFAQGGEKGLWTSRVRPDDSRLVIAESAIDAMSRHALKPDARTRYASAGGGWSPKTREALLAAAHALPGDEVALAFDHDEAGRGYEAAARELLAPAGKRLVADFPPTPGRDWNDELRGVESKGRQWSGRAFA